jgi:excisionase family DNA binding protein
MSLTPSPKLYTVQEIADALRVHSRTAYRLVKEGKIKGIKVGSQWRIPESALLEYIDSGWKEGLEKKKGKDGPEQLKLPL